MWCTKWSQGGAIKSHFIVRRTYMYIGGRFNVIWLVINEDWRCQRKKKTFLSINIRSSNSIKKLLVDFSKSQGHTSQASAIKSGHWTMIGLWLIKRMLENVVEGALGGTLLSAANQGGDSAGGAWGRRRREGGDGAFWDMFVKGRVLSNQSCCT